MPLYDFECLACGHIFEQERKMNDAPPPCASCGGANTEKRLSPPAIIFKGKGFYKTDSAVSRSSPPKKEGVKEEKKTEGTAAERKQNGGDSPGSAAIAKGPATQEKANGRAKTGSEAGKKVGE